MPDSDRRGAAILDTIAHPQGVNLLDVYGGAARTAADIWRTRDWQARQASGEASQQATDAQGNYDPARAQAIMAGNPAAALDYQRSAAAGQELGNRQLGLNRDQMGTIARSVSSVLALPDDQQTAENYRAALDHALSQGAITKAHHDAGVANLPTTGGPQALRNYGTRLLIGTLSGPDVANNVLPRWQQTNTGQEVQPQLVQPPTAGGAVTNAPGATPIVPSRDSLNERVVTGYDGEGNPIYGPKLAVTPPALAGPLGSGRAPPALLNPNRPGAAPAPAPTTGMVTGQGPATAAAQSATGTQSAAAFQGYADQALQAQSQTAILGNMLADTTQFTTGPLADRITRLRAVANRFGLSVDKEATSAAESFNKLAAQLANAQGGGNGPGSDARLNVSIAANPHADLSPAGVDLMLRQLQGNADYLGARAKLAADWPNKADRAGFEQSYGTKLDPRAFQFARLTGPQKVEYEKSLSAADRKSVAAAYNYAHGAGLISGG